MASIATYHPFGGTSAARSRAQKAQNDTKIPKEKSRGGLGSLRLFAGGHPMLGGDLKDHFNNCTRTKHLQRVKMHLCLAPFDSQKSAICSVSGMGGSMVSLRVEVE